MKKNLIKILLKRPIRNVIKKFWSPQKLNIGDNNKRFKCWGWVTADIANADYIVDFRKDNLPIADQNCGIVYTSHMIEHITDDSVVRLFEEVYCR